jgi:hypothetical protein
MSGPVIRLQSLTPEEMHVLIERLRFLWAGGDPERLPVTDTALTAFLDHCSKKIGDDYFRTPRNTIRAFLDLLAILEQNPGAEWATLLGAIDITPDRPAPQPDITDEARDGKPHAAETTAGDGEDSLASFNL